MTHYSSGLSINHCTTRSQRSQSSEMYQGLSEWHALIQTFQWFSPFSLCIALSLPINTVNLQYMHWNISTAQQIILCPLYFQASSMIQVFNYFPIHHDPKDYTNPTPPSPSNCSHLTAFSYACWDRQFGNSIPNSTPWSSGNIAVSLATLSVKQGALCMEISASIKNPSVQTKPKYFHQ